MRKRLFTHTRTHRAKRFEVAQLSEEDWIGMVIQSDTMKIHKHTHTHLNTARLSVRERKI